MEGIIIPSNEEVRAAAERQRELFQWAMGLEKEQINYLCDGGWYNDTMKGYLIAAGENAGYDRESIRELLNGLRLALSDMSKADADKVYMDF